MTRCPVCKRTLGEETVCSRCGAEIETLLEIAREADRLIAVGEAALVSGRADAAARAFLASDKLKTSERAKIGAALAAARAERFDDALKLYRRVSERAVL